MTDPNPFHAFEARFKLRRTSGDHDAPGVHAPGSFHYVHAPWGGVEAYDYGDSRNKADVLHKASTYVVGKATKRQKYRGKHIREMFFGHIDHVVKNGQVYAWHEFDPSGVLRAHHMNHMHLALSA